MTEQDYDHDLAQRLERRLAAYAPMGRIAESAGPRRWQRVLATSLAATLLATLLGAGLQINAAADAAGLSCADVLTKVQLFASGLADQFRGSSIEEQRAAKQRLNEYATPLLISSGCGGPDVKGGLEWRPRPSPSGNVDQAAPTMRPGATPKAGGATPAPSPTGK